nr:hypothetical protein CFP56_57698 [Quercus suber]
MSAHGTFGAGFESAVALGSAVEFPWTARSGLIGLLGRFIGVSSRNARCALDGDDTANHNVAIKLLAQSMCLQSSDAVYESQLEIRCSPPPALRKGDVKNSMITQIVSTLS